MTDPDPVRPRPSLVVTRLLAFGIALAGGVLLGWWTSRAAGAPPSGAPAATQLLTDAGERQVDLADGTRLRLRGDTRVQLTRALRGARCLLEQGALEVEGPRTAGRTLGTATSHLAADGGDAQWTVALADRTRVTVARGVLRVSQADGARCLLVPGFSVESSGAGALVPRAEDPALGAAPLLGCTWPRGDDGLGDGLSTLRSSKRRHWIGLDVARSAVSWAWSDAFHAQPARILTLQNAFFWDDIVRLDVMDQAAAFQAVDAWLAAFLARYRGKLRWWELVDEPVTPAYATRLGGAGASGWDWLVGLYARARAQAPETVLLLGGLSDLGSADAIARMLDAASVLRAQGLLDGLVVRAHDLQRLEPRMVQAALDRLATAGVPLHLEEVVIDVADDQAHAAGFARLFPVLWCHPAVRSVGFWGLRDGASLRLGDHLVASDGTARPALAWLRDWLARDVMRVAAPLVVPGADGGQALVVRPGFAGPTVTRLEAVRGGRIIASAPRLPALLTLPAAADGVLLRAYAGERLVAESQLEHPRR